MRPSDGGRGFYLIAPPLVFLVGLGVRLLAWQDSAVEAGRVQTGVTAGYRRLARLLYEGGFASFFDAASPAADPDLLGHPPGYSLLWALAARLFGDADAPPQLFQIACDAASAAIVCLIAAELLPRAAAALAGLLAALAPQFAWNSVLLLPDALAVLPLLLAVYCLARALKRPRAATLFAAGALVGLSCWLRANALLLAPFLCLFVPVLFERGRRARLSASLVCGALVVVAPLTIRNAVVFRRFVPVSLGAGQTMLEGIADYDEAGRFGIPQTDLGIMRQEADAAGRPDYAQTLFGPDAVERERARLRRALGVVVAHPFWFAGVMARRAASMLRLERARLVSADPPVTNPLPLSGAHEPVAGFSPSELLARGTLASPNARAELAPDGTRLRLFGDETKDGRQLVSPPLALRAGTDYLITLPVRLEQGRLLFEAVGADGAVLASTFIDTAEVLRPGEQPVQRVLLAFASRRDGEARAVVRKGAAPRAAAEIGAVELFRLGDSSGLWTRPLRLLVRAAQKIFITAVVLPLALVGAFSLALRRDWRTLALLCAVPAYYLCVQSALHTEYRYVLAVQHFQLILAAAALRHAAAATRLLRPLRAHPRTTNN